MRPLGPRISAGKIIRVSVARIRRSGKPRAPVHGLVVGQFGQWPRMAIRPESPYSKIGTPGGAEVTARPAALRPCRFVRSTTTTGVRCAVWPCAAFAAVLFLRMWTRPKGTLFAAISVIWGVVRTREHFRGKNRRRAPLFTKVFAHSLKLFQQNACSLL